MENSTNNLLIITTSTENIDIKMEKEEASTLAETISNIKTNGSAVTPVVGISPETQDNAHLPSESGEKEEDETDGEDTTHDVELESESEDDADAEIIPELHSVKDDVSENEEGEKSYAEDRAEISLHVRAEEYEELEETSTGEDRNSIKAHSILSEGSIEDDGKTKAEVELVERKSDLHCAFCGELIRDGRLLVCLHTFCVQCLKKVTKKEFKFIFCPLCKGRTILPKGGIENLPRNVLFTNLVEKQTESQLSQECVVCKLIGKEEASTAKCVTCGDLLCSDCSSKHTFSRQTARHTVVPLSDMESAQGLVDISGTELVYCPTHRTEELKFYCHECGHGVCRDCVLLGHNLHQITSDVADVHEKLKDNILKGCQRLHDKAKQQGSEELEKYLNKMDEEEERQKQILENAKSMALKLIEKKYENSLNLMQKAFRKSRENYLRKKRDFEKGYCVIECFEENINFLLRHGNALEMIAMEKVLTEALTQQENDLKCNIRKACGNEVLPEVKVFNENLKLVESTSLFRIVLPQDHHRGKHNREEGKHNKEVGKHNKEEGKHNKEVGKHNKEEGKHNKEGVRNTGQESTKVRDSSRQKSSNTTNSAQIYAKSRGLNLPMEQNLTPSKSHPFFPRSVGRGILSNSSPFCTSLLGEFPTHVSLGQEPQHSGCQSLYQTQKQSTMTPMGNFCRQSNQQNRPAHGYRDIASDVLSGGPQLNREAITRASKKSPGTKMSWREDTTKDIGDERLVKMKGQGNQGVQRIDTVLSSLMKNLIHLKLRSSINIRVALENVEPKVTGIVFTKPHIFALSDSRNNRVKLFGTEGKFLTVVEDERPGSITVAQDHLIWNSNGSDIKVKICFTLS